LSQPLAVTNTIGGDVRLYSSQATDTTGSRTWSRAAWHSIGRHRRKRARRDGVSRAPATRRSA